MTVVLIPQARDRLGRLQDRTGLSATDLLNRSIVLYEFTEAQLGMGRELLLRDTGSGTTWRIQFR